MESKVFLNFLGCETKLLFILILKIVQKFEAKYPDRDQKISNYASITTKMLSKSKEKHSQILEFLDSDDIFIR